METVAAQEMTSAFASKDNSNFGSYSSAGSQILFFLSTNLNKM